MLPCSAFPIVEGRAVITAEVSVRGESNGHRVGGRLWVGTDLSTGSLRLESIQTPPFFVFIANNAFKGQNDTSDVDGTLLLPRGNWVVQRETSRTLLQAIIGLPLSAQEFLWAFSGCPSWSGSISGQRFGPTLMGVLVGDVLPVESFLRRKDVRSPWTLFAIGRNIAGRTLRWRAEFDNRLRGLFRTIRIVTRAVDFAHAALAQRREDFIGTQSSARSHLHVCAATPRALTSQCSRVRCGARRGRRDALIRAHPSFSGA
jgi:hypothetical protein